MTFLCWLLLTLGLWLITAWFIAVLFGWFTRAVEACDRVMRNESSSA